MKSIYKRFELLKFYLAVYKLYRLNRKMDKCTEYVKKYKQEYTELELALKAGFYSAKKFNADAQKLINGMGGKKRLQQLAGIKS